MSRTLLLSLSRIQVSNAVGFYGAMMLDAIIYALALYLLFYCSV
jgi:hypothetical protein